MAALVDALPWVAGTLVCLLSLILLQRPLRGLVRLTARTAVSLGALWAFAPVGSLIGAGLGVNLFNALVLGVLGIPGFGLLLLTNWAVRM